MQIFLLICSFIAFVRAADVTIDVSKPIATIDDRYVGAGYEMWDYLYNLDLLKDSTFINLSNQLNLGVLRVGGITADFVKYILTEENSVQPPQEKTPQIRVGEFWPNYNKNVTIADFKLLINYAKNSNTHLVFGLNEIYGRDCHVNNTSKCVGAWDTSNLREFLQYIHDNQVGPIFAFELGNELTRSQHISMATNIADYKQLNEIRNSIWTDPNNRPPIVGPSTDICDDTVVQFMSETKSFLTGFTFHTYPGNSGVDLNKQLLDVEWLKTGLYSKDLHANSIFCVETWEKIGKPVGMKLWITETNSAYNDVDGVMNAFINGYWYLASLSQFAQVGVTLHSRWALHGGTFAFINTTNKNNITPTPNYWNAVVYKKVVGNNVFQVTTTATDSLYYAHCGKTKGSLVLIVLNPSSAPVPVTIQGMNTYPREEYIFTATSLSSYELKLNGFTLQASSSGILPPLNPRKVATGGLTLPPLSYGFVNFPSANVANC